MRYFNPRSREGSDTIHIISVNKSIISIHAPAKGATTFSLSLRRIIKISIHAPAKGATDRDAMGVTITKNFNPRSREGSDHV